LEQARYLYCIAGTPDAVQLGKVGVLGGEVSTLPFKDIAGVVSPVAYKELESNLANIMVHQKVVELTRSKSTVLPVRFGVIFRSADGVRQLLSKSYATYREKLDKLGGKDEYGVKMIMNSDGTRLLAKAVTKGSPQLAKLAKASAKASKGTAYLLKLKAEEALKAESLRALEDVCRTVDGKLSKEAVDMKRLPSDHELIVLNAAYLVEAGSADLFRKAVEQATKDVQPMGLELHMSGPWAPYSFC
jgi:Gas vesicle synthesis protein GvpL/GvpF